MTSDLEEIARRVEAATGPDRELDEAILLAVGGKKRSSEWWLGFAYIGRIVPAYTASLDAAMTLFGDADVAFARIGGHSFAGLGSTETNGSEVKAATPALALTAAALRARIAHLGGNDAR